MNKNVTRSVSLLCLMAAAAMAQAPKGLSGTVTDPSGASVPGASVRVRGPKGEQRQQTDTQGRYTFLSLAPGAYEVRINAKGFKAVVKPGVQAGTVLDAQLDILAEAQEVTVEDDTGSVSTDPASNASALVLKEKELSALSDDPDELEQQLQALAGPATGPNGGQIFIDGFTGGRLPPKASIREIRINSNPYSPEYDRPGFGRIEVFTKPGADKIRGMAFFQFNNQSFNSRNPLLTQSTRPPYEQKFFGFDLRGPLVKQKASFGLNAERRSTNENAFILATTLDSSLNPLSVNQVVVTPQVRTSISPRLDFNLNAKNTLVLRYQNSRTSRDNEGVGNFSLASRAYNTTDSENTFQLTETAVLSAKAVNETRFQFLRSSLSRLGDNSVPALSVQGAFEGGGAQIGNSYTNSNHFELSNITTYISGTHTYKWGARLRQSMLGDTSVNNFGGTYTFFGGEGPVLDANNQPVAGTSVPLTAIERYRRTLTLLAAGYSAEQIRLLGGGASQFSLSAGVPALSVNQFDAGLFVNDDWRIRPNITLSYGLRYEMQTNISDYTNLTPRIGLAWGIGRRQGGQAKTVLRAGFGTFYDRVDDTLTLQAMRFNGLTQQSYLIRNPDFYPQIPSVETLAGSAQPQRLQILYSGLQAPRVYQSSISVDRQISSSARMSVQYINTRGVHLERVRNINAPIDGSYPYGDQQLRMLTESTGESRTNQLIFSPNVNYKKIFLFGFYALSYGKSNAEGSPADPYNLRAEWGPSSFADVRHRVVVGTNIPLPFKFAVSPFFMASTGRPYNITTGSDTNGDGIAAERPALVGVLPTACAGGSLIYSPMFGCFDLNAPAGTAISRNYGRGPGMVNLNLRLSRTWGFGKSAEQAAPDRPDGPPPGMRGGGMRGGPGGGGFRGGGGMMGGGGGGRGMFGGGRDASKRYSLTLSISAMNVLNHANYAAPSGDLSSPFFGQYRGLMGLGPAGGAGSYLRKVDFQLRFGF